MATDEVKSCKSATLETSLPPSLNSLESVLLIVLLPILDYNRLLYIYSCLPLHFVDMEWSLWSLTALLFLSALIRNLVAFLIERSGDWVAVPMLAAVAIASAGMAVLPNSYVAVFIAMFVSQVVKCYQPNRGMCATSFGAWPEQHATALRIMNVSDVVGYSSAAFLGGVLYESGGFQACATFQTCVSTAQAILTFALPAARTATSIKTTAAVTPSEESNAPAMESEVQEAPTLREKGILSAACVVIAAGSLSIFCYSSEWNTYALYFREVWGWGSAWTGFAQMAGDLLAGGALLVSSNYNIEMPHLVQPPHGVAVSLSLYAIFFAMLAQSDFAVAVTGQVAMGSAYVLTSELVSQMLRTYGHGDPLIYRRLLLWYEVAFNGGVALSSAAIVLYGWQRNAPFWGCAFLAISFAGGYATFFWIRFRGQGGLCLRARTFDEIEGKLLEERLAKHSKQLEVPL